jgi:tRNA (cytidine32/guanosine34-2'-O)-methyltransferase
VITLKGDITSKQTAERVIAHFEGDLADLVVSDGAPDVTGLHDMDEYVQGQLLLAALGITTHILKPGGTFVAKIFRGPNVSLLEYQLGMYFTHVTVAKPASSRNSSIEAFVVCQHYSPQTLRPIMMDTLLPYPFTEQWEEIDEAQRKIVPFVACGDLSGWDADRTYPLTHVPLEVVQAPINPPYKRAIQLRRTNQLTSP